MRTWIILEGTVDALEESAREQSPVIGSKHSLESDGGEGVPWGEVVSGVSDSWHLAVEETEDENWSQKGDFAD